MQARQEVMQATQENRQAWQEGKIEGEKLGIAKGMEQAKEEIAYKFLEIGTSVEDIIKATGLSVETIKDLESQLK